MRLATVVVAIFGVFVLLAGCGGGLTQEEMRRHAISRKSSSDDGNNAAPTPGAGTKPGDKANTPKGAVAVPQQAPVAPTAKHTAAKAGSHNNVAHPSGTDVTLPVLPNPLGSAPTGNMKTAADAPADSAPPPTAGKPAEPLSLVEQRQRTIENLTTIGKAMSRYVEKNERFFARAICDPKGQPLLSWRVELLPYLGQQELYDQFALTEPWDSAHNLPLAQLIPPVYQSPERFDSNTNYQVPVASFTPFGSLRGIGLRQFEDGVENTVVLLEVDDSAAIPWTKPDDFKVNLKTFNSQVGTLRQDGFFVVWGNGLVTRVAAERSTTDVKAILSIDGGDQFTSHVVRATANATPTATETGPESDAAVQSVATERSPRLPLGVPTSYATTGGPLSPTASERVSVPDTQKLDKARTLIREIYKNEYADARTARAQQALAQEMLKRSAEMRDDTAGQYVMLDIVIQIATQAGDSGTAIAAMEQIMARFDIDAAEELKIQHDILQTLAKKRDRGRAVNQALLDQTGALIDQALQAEQFDIAKSLCQMALGAARQLANEKEEAKLEQQQKLVAEARNAYRSIHRTMAALEDADDPKANLEAGRYYCLIRGQWNKGLPLLAQGQHEQLKQLAEAELSDPTEGTEQLELADGWWELGNKDASHRKMLRLHAAQWYLRALERLPQGLLRVKAELRVKDIEREYGSEALAALGLPSPR